MDTETAQQEWDKIHNGPQTVFRTNIIDLGLSYESKKKDVSLNYVPLDEWVCFSREKQADWYRQMVEAGNYSPPDIETHENLEPDDDRERETRYTIMWMLVCIIVMLFLNCLGVSSVLELLF